MASYLLTWNPKRFVWTDLPDVLADLDAVGAVAVSWSCGRTKRIREGDSVYLLRQGKDSPGIVGRGWVVTEPFYDEHWVDEQGVDSPALYILALWDVLSDLPLIHRSELMQPPFDSVHWNSQTSGISIDPTVAAILAERLDNSYGLAGSPFPEEVDDSGYPEGSLKRIWVNAYERSATARARCIAHHGWRCAACDLLLSERYGPVAEGLIHVHHLRPVSQLGHGYHVDPVADLRPICPTCHAVIHRRTPPLSIKEVRTLLHTLPKP